MQKNRCVVIVAGGSGRRMGTEIPKQFLMLAGRPLLMHTLQKFFDFDAGMRIIVVLPFAHIETWNRLCAGMRFIIPHQIATGGHNRFDSVKNGLALVTDDEIVAIHDGARPLVSHEVIESCFAAAEESGSAIPVIRPSESLREVVHNASRPVDREQFRMVQTPQTFRAKLIKAAYRQPFQQQFTDDATVFEAAGHEVRLVDGHPENIKITLPADLQFAEWLIRESKAR